MQEALDTLKAYGDTNTSTYTKISKIRPYPIYDTNANPWFVSFHYFSTRRFFLSDKTSRRKHGSVLEKVLVKRDVGIS
jgi:hypothetical protein